MNHEKYPVRLEVFYYHRGKKSVMCKKNMMLTLKQSLEMVSKGPEWALDVAHSYSSSLPTPPSTIITVKWDYSSINGCSKVFVGDVPFEVFSAFSKAFGHMAKFKSCPEHETAMVKEKIQSLEQRKTAIEAEIKRLKASLT